MEQVERSIIILGSGQGWEKCPYDMETWVVAKMLMLPEPPKRVDTIFNMDDLHRMLSFSTSAHRASYSKEEFIEKMNQTGVPFITSYPYPELTHSISYPFKDIVEKYGVIYFTNTICYMLAYAIFTGVRHITLWGVNQAGTREYMMERKGVEFWIGIAAGMGIEINIEGPSSLLKIEQDTLYGYKKTIPELIKEFNIHEKS